MLPHLSPPYTSSFKPPRPPSSATPRPHLPRFKPLQRPLSANLLHPPTVPLLAGTKKRREQPQKPPSPAINSTKFNYPPFNIHPYLNIPVNNLHPKFNPIQPFAHFVLHTNIHQTPHNSLIYTHSTIIIHNPPLYISFSRPYRHILVIA